MSPSIYILGIALAFTCASCGGSDDKKVSLEQTRAAIEVRDAWQNELKPVEINAEGSIDGADKIGVRLTSDGKTNILSFSGYGTYKPEKPSLMADTAASVTACWPMSHTDTLSLTAPFSDRIYGRETARKVGDKMSFTMLFKSSMALLRVCLESDNIGDVLASLSLKGEAIKTQAKYMPYAGKWIESAGEGMPVVDVADCLLNNGRNHDFYLVPCDAASDIVLSAIVNGKEYLLKTKIPPLAAGSMTQLNLKVENEGMLVPKSSWVDNERKTDLRSIATVDSVVIGNYLRKDGLIVAKRDTLTVAVIFQSDGKHGKAIAIEDLPDKYIFGNRNLTSGHIFPTIDGKRTEGKINDSSSLEDERLIYRPDIPYSDDTAFGFKSGAELTSKLLQSEGKRDSNSMLAPLEKFSSSYLPTLAEMVEVFYKLQPYAKTNLHELIEPFSGEYVTCSESTDHNLYGIDMTKGVVMSNYSKQYAQLKLRLFFLF